MGILPSPRLSWAKAHLEKTYWTRECATAAIKDVLSGFIGDAPAMLLFFLYRAAHASEPTSIESNVDQVLGL
ncbi:hypothetical protein RSP799_20665 [Ralstonia solanacearum]|nr:hypothetical protein RSP799_20665 [Ralstonia solanacearum]